MYTFLIRHMICMTILLHVCACVLRDLVPRSIPFPRSCADPKSSFVYFCRRSPAAKGGWRKTFVNFLFITSISSTSIASVEPLVCHVPAERT